jgi:hypothetical protein
VGGGNEGIGACRVRESVVEQRVLLRGAREPKDALALALVLRLGGDLLARALGLGAGAAPWSGGALLAGAGALLAGRPILLVVQVTGGGLLGGGGGGRRRRVYFRRGRQLRTAGGEARGGRQLFGLLRAV